MRILARNHIRWVIVASVAGIAAMAVFVSYWEPEVGVRSGSVPSMWLAIAGSLLMVFSALLGLRRRRRYAGRRLGSLRLWLTLHIWMGLLGFFLVGLHTNGRLGGLLETALVALVGIVVLTGVYGWCAQSIVPKLITQEVRLETFREQHVDRCLQMREDADKVVAKLCQISDSQLMACVESGAGSTLPSLADAAADSVEQNIASEVGQGRAALLAFYLDRVRPMLAPPFSNRLTLPRPDLVRSAFAAQRVRLNVGPELKDALNVLEEYCQTRLQYERQLTLYFWMYGWLPIHILATVAGVILLLLHVWSALRVTPGLSF